MVLAASLSGCGSNGGAVGVDREGFNFSSTQGNFITTTVEVENRFFYILNRTDNNVSGLYAVTEEEGHDHAHGRIMTQEDDHDDKSYACEEDDQQGKEPVMSCEIISPDWNDCRTVSVPTSRLKSFRMSDSEIGSMAIGL